MLCGVGGRTVAEAQRRLSYAEFVDWCRYRDQFGSMHMGMRIDRAVARHIAAYLNTLSKRTFRAEDFSPYDQPAARAPVDVNDLNAVWQVLKGVSDGSNVRDIDS